MLGLVFSIPIVLDYLGTGLVERFPTLIACGFTIVAALLSNIFWADFTDYDSEKPAGISDSDCSWHKIYIVCVCGGTKRRTADGDQKAGSIYLGGVMDGFCYTAQTLATRYISCAGLWRRSLSTDLGIRPRQEIR